MGTSGPPGSFDLQKILKASTSPSIPPSNHPSGFHTSHNDGYHASSHPVPHSSSTTGPHSSASLSGVPGTHSFPLGPVYQSYMHYLQDQWPRAASYPSHPFVQAPFPQPPNVQHSATPQLHMEDTASNPPLNGARLMALLSTQSSAESISKGGPHIAVSNSTSHPELSPVLSSMDLGSSEVSRPPPAISPALPTAPPVSLVLSTLSTSLSTRKVPNGRSLAGEHVTYDIDARHPGEAHPQLEVSPITVYGSDPVLLVGRQIAVNNSYICYGLKNATIRVLSMHADLKLLLRGHSQRVTDMVFLSDDVHILASASADGTVFVNKIVESYSDDGKGQINGQILVAVRFFGDWEKSAHPRLCWLSETEDNLAVAIGKYVMIVDIGKVRMAAPSGGLTAEEPLTCHIKIPVEGVHVVGVHDAEVTELSTFPLMASWLASSSIDGTVHIWGGKEMLSQALFVPHEGHPVGFVSFLSAPHLPNHLVLLTAGPLNRELKMWVAAGPDGSFNVTGKWQCIQCLEFKSSVERRHDVAFFNQVMVIPNASLILIANAKRNALYAVHVEFGSLPAATRMVYLAEFSVTMPILSFIALGDNISDGEGIVRVYCVQTQAIQQYSLDLSQCLSHVQEVSGETLGLCEKGLGPKVFKLSGSSDYSSIDASQVSGSASNSILVNGSTVGADIRSPTKIRDVPNISAIYQASSSSLGVFHSVDQGADVKTDSQPASVLPIKELKEFIQKEDTVNISDRASFSNREKAITTLSKASPSTKSTRSESPSKFSLGGNIEVTISSADKTDKLSLQGCSVTSTGGLVVNSLSEATGRSAMLVQSQIIEADLAVKTEQIECDIKSESEDLVSSMDQPSSWRSLHLITPSELMSLGVRSKEEADITSLSLPLRLDSDMMLTDLEQETLSVKSASVSDTKSFKADSQMTTENIPRNNKELITERLETLDNDNRISEAIIAPQTGNDLESSLKEQTFDVRSLTEVLQDAVPSGDIEGELLEDQKNFRALLTEEHSEHIRDVRAPDSKSVNGPSPILSKGRRNKSKTNLATSVPSSPPQAAVASISTTMITSEGDFNSNQTDFSDGLAAQYFMMQNTLNQLVTMQMEFQKQMAVMVGVPVVKEGKRIEASVGQRLERVIKAHVDLMSAKIQEDNVKRDKLEHDRVLQLTTLLSNFLNKDLPSALERVLRKELASIAPAVVKLSTPSIEKTVSSTVTDVLQKGIFEKTLPQLEKTVTAKLETSVAKHLQSEFQNSGRHALQDALRSCFEGSVIPSFEKSCKVMFEQVDAAFQKGMAEHTSSAQKQFAACHTALASTLQDTVASATSLVASLKGELADGQRKLVALAENTGSSAPRFSMISKPTGGNLPDKVLSLQHLEESLDPTIEIARLLAARKFEDSFNRALSVTDVAVVSWLCNQVDPVTLFGTNPLPLSQSVILSLMQQLGCDLGKDTGRKLTWIREAALRLNPSDSVLALHMRPVLDQLYNNLRRQLLILPATGELTTPLTLVIHVVNSLLTACK